MIKELIEKHETDLPVLFGVGVNITVNRAQLEAALELIKVAQITDDINEQIRSLQSVQKILERFLK